MRGLPNLGILTVRGPLQTPLVAPLRNGAVYRARDEAHGHGHVRVRLPVEGVRKGIVEALVNPRLVAALGFDGARSLRQHLIHPNHVGHKHIADGYSRLIILVQELEVALVSRRADRIIAIRKVMRSSRLMEATMASPY